jgi:hypothetical protein
MIRFTTMRVLVQLAAALLLLLLLWRAFRMAMAMRYSRVVREDERRAMESRGRRVVAEVPNHAGEVYLFVEDAETFQWPGQALRKADITGCRLLLNGGLMGTATRPGVSLPEPTAPGDFEGRERWDVRVYAGQTVVDIPCGTLREGVSREAARAVFQAVREAVSGAGRGAISSIG